MRKDDDKLLKCCYLSQIINSCLALSVCRRRRM